MRSFLISILFFLPLPGHAAEPIVATAEQIRAGVLAFVENCEGCHGEQGAGGNSPNIQGVTLRDIRVALQGFEEMPEFDLDPMTTENLAAYLMSLAPDEARKRLAQ